MSIYGNTMIESLSPLVEEEAIDEALLDPKMKALMKDWNTSNGGKYLKEYNNNSLSEKEYSKLQHLVKQMRTVKKYEDYKRYFESFCRMCHIVPRGTIICTIDLNKDEKSGKMSIKVKYSYNVKKIKIPDGMSLYHVSRVDNIKKLKPFFRGKLGSRGMAAKGGYLYDKPRIYLTIHENIPKMAVDYKWYEDMNKYEVKSDIRYVYVDPLVPWKALGAVYIETDKEIPVEKIN